MFKVYVQCLMFSRSFVAMLLWMTSEGDYWMTRVITLFLFMALRIRSAKGSKAWRGWLRQPGMTCVPRMMLPSSLWWTPLPGLSMGQ